MSVIRFERTGNLGHIVLCAPPRNLIGTYWDVDMKAALAKACRSDIRALLIRSEGPNFSDGGDVAEFLTLDTESFRTFINGCHTSYRTLEAMPFPTVAAVRGNALGGAFELALACDMIVASEDATFQSIETWLGSAPLCGAVQRVAERAGRAVAARYMMLSEPIGGKLAGELRIAAFVEPDDAVEGKALALAEKLASGPTRSLLAIRSMLKAWSGGGIAAADAMLLDLTMPLHGSEDARAGRAERVKALAEGRLPVAPAFVGR